jgi:hypothetical protein
MKKLAVLVVALAILGLATTALASSKTISQSGQIVGDKATQVTLRVKVKNGVAIKVSGFNATGVLTRCGGVVKRYQYSVLGQIPVTAGSFDGYGVDDPTGLRITLKGTVKDSGRSTVGTVKSNSFDLKGTSCKVPKQKFKTSK